MEQENIITKLENSLEEFIRTQDQVEGASQSKQVIVNSLEKQGRGEELDGNEWKEWEEVKEEGRRKEKGNRREVEEDMKRKKKGKRGMGRRGHGEGVEGKVGNRTRRLKGGGGKRKKKRGKTKGLLKLGLK